MSRKQKKTLWRIITAALLLVGAAMLPISGWWRLLVFLVPYAVIGYDVLWKALRGIFRGQVFDENLLMALATFGALCIGEYAEAVFVMLFYQVGVPSESKMTELFGTKKSILRTSRLATSFKFARVSVCRWTVRSSRASPTLTPPH